MMSVRHYYIKTMDQWLMPIYRLPDESIWGMYLGTFVLAMAAVVIGNVTLNLALIINKRRVGEYRESMVKMNNLSIEALQAGDGDSYRACNTLGNDAVGRMFFLNMTFSVAALWPAPFALAWMQSHFNGVSFPLFGLGITFNYMGVFIPLYVLAHLVFGKIRPYIPVLKNGRGLTGGAGSPNDSMKSWTDLLAPPPSKG
jgi:hypothetical protein